MEATLASSRLEVQTESTTAALHLQEAAVRGLIGAYVGYADAAGLAGLAASRAVYGIPARGKGGAPMKLAKGTSRVPGTGNKDTIPALLTPGESVVTKQATQRYGPIIEAMNKGTLPGFADGLYSDSHLSHGTEGRILTEEEFKALQATTNNKKAKGSNRARGLTNWVYDLPKVMNNGNMTGSEVAKMFKGKAAKQVMKPIYKALSQQLGREMRDVQRDPAIRKFVRKISSEMSSGLAQLENTVVNDAEFYRVNNDAVAKALKESTLTVEQKAAVERARTQITTVRWDKVDEKGKVIHGNGTRTPVSQANQKNIFGAERGVTSYRDNPDFPKGGWEGKLQRFFNPVGDAIRASRGRQTSRVRAATTVPSQPIPVTVENQDVRTRTSGRAEWRARQGAIRAELAAIDKIPAKRQSMIQAAKTGPMGEGDTRSIRRTRIAQIRAMADEDILKIVQTEERERIQAAKDASRQRNALREKQTKKAIAVEKTQALKSTPVAATLPTEIEAGRAAAGKQSFGSRFKGAVTSPRAKGIMHGAGTAGMALSMASMVPAMAADEQGKFMGMDANTAMFGMMGAGTVMSMLPAMMGPQAPIMAAIAAATAAIAGLGIALWNWRDGIDSLAQKSAKLGSDIGGTSNALTNMAAVMGTTTPQQRQTQMQMGVTQEQSTAMWGEWGQYLGSGAGEQFVNDLREVTSAERFRMLSDYLKNAIATGMLSEQQAQDFGRTVATQLNDGVLGIRASQAVQGQATGLVGMQSLAKQRMDALSSSAAMNSLKSRGLMSVENSSAVVGGSIQVIQDFSNVMALAREEYAAGTISFSEMRNAVDAARDAQAQYTEKLSQAIARSDDPGATRQAVKGELVRSGKVTAEQYDAATAQFGDIQSDKYFDLLGQMVLDTGLSPTDPAIKDKAKAMTVKAQADMESLYIGLIADGMNAIDAQGLAASIGVDENMTRIYETLLGQGYNNIDAAKTMQIVVGMQDEQKAIAAEAYNMAVAGGKSMIEAAIAARDAYKVSGSELATLQKYVESGGNAADFQTFEMNLPEADKAAVLAQLATATAEQVNRYVSDFSRLNGILGSIDTTMLVMRSQEYKNALMNNTSPMFTKMIEDAKTMFGDNFEPFMQNQLAPAVGFDPTSSSIDSVNSQLSEIDNAKKNNRDYLKKEKLEQELVVTLTEDPSDLQSRLENLMGYYDKLSLIPTDVLLTLGIDITNPEQVELYGPMADDLSALSGVIEGMPQGAKDFAATVAFKMVDGKKVVKSPKEFIADTNALIKDINKIDKQKDKNVKKRMTFQLISETLTESGNVVSEDAVRDRYNQLVKEWGKKNIENLPTDVITKAIMVDFNGDQLIQAGMAMSNAAASLYQAGAVDEAKELEKQAGAYIDAGTALKAASASQIGSAVGQNVGNNPSSSGGGGGGGGGEKANPFKDFKSMILKQIKQYADAGADMKSLLSAKYGFFKILNLQKGIDDKIRKAGLSSGVSEYLMGLDPKEAQKVLGKITGKNGKLNAEGRKLEDRYMAGQISQSNTTNQDRITAAGIQRNALTNLAARGSIKLPKGVKQGMVSADAIEAIAGDPKKAEEYMYFVDKVAEKKKAMDNASKKNREQATKEWKQANSDLQQYINLITVASRAEIAAAKDAEMATAHRRSVATVGLTNIARNVGASKEVVDAVATGEHTEQYQVRLAKLKKAEQDYYNNRTKANKKALAEARTEYNNFFAIIQQGFWDAEAAAAAADPWMKAADDSQAMTDAVNAQFEAMTLNLEEQSDIKFKVDYGVSKEGAEQLIKKNDVLIAQAQAQINTLQRANDLEQRAIDLHEREKQQWQDKIEAIQDVIEGYQRQVEVLQHENELRNHQADLMNHELDIMSRQEDSINEAYDKRVEALEKSATLNQRIIEQQKQQIGLAQALTEGDIYAAAQAAADMNQSSAQYASDQTRTALDEGRDNAVNGLVGANGMTRVQMEEQLWQIQQMNYQNELLMWDLEQKIYAQNLLIVPLKDEIEKIDDLIREHTDAIFVNNGKILEIQQQQLDPLTQQNALWNDRLTTSKTQLEYDTANLKFLGKSAQTWQKMNDKLSAHMKATSKLREIATGVFDTWLNIGEAIASANRTAKQNLTNAYNGNFKAIVGVQWEDFLKDDGTFDYDRFANEVTAIRDSTISAELQSGAAAMQTPIAKAAGGFVPGDGSRDSVPGMLTPGEFIVRKSMVDKYGMPMLNSINTGSFSQPKYNMSSAGSAAPRASSSSNSSVNMPVYNNRYNINVSVPSTNANADEIANTVLTKIKMIESMTVRGNRGY